MKKNIIRWEGNVGFYLDYRFRILIDRNAPIEKFQFGKGWFGTLSIIPKTKNNLAFQEEKILKTELYQTVKEAKEDLQNKFDHYSRKKSNG